MKLYERLPKFQTDPDLSIYLRSLRGIKEPRQHSVEESTSMAAESMAAGSCTDRRQGVEESRCGASPPTDRGRGVVLLAPPRGKVLHTSGGSLDVRSHPVHEAVEEPMSRMFRRCFYRKESKSRYGLCLQCGMEPRSRLDVQQCMFCWGWCCTLACVHAHAWGCGGLAPPTPDTVDTDDEDVVIKTLDPHLWQRR